MFERSEHCWKQDPRQDVSRKGNGKEADVKCKAIETRGQGECVRVLSMCRIAGAEAVMWSEMAESEASTSSYLTGEVTFNT